MARLVPPTVALHAEFVSAVREREPEPVRHWLAGDAAGMEELVDGRKFEQYVQQLLAEAEPGPHLPAGWVPHTTLWWVEDGRFLGVVDIRHALTPTLTEVGGHVGYGVRPSARRRGHATAMLRASLAVAAALGLPRVLVTCDADNVGSIRVIEANGGILENRRGQKLRYWLRTAG
jgi:predicted acetyltransferase